MALNANQLNMLVTLCDNAGVKIDQIPEKLHKHLEVLVQKKLASSDGNIVNPTAKGLLCVESAKSEMNFVTILNKMNHRMLINLWHRLLEVSQKRNVHLNVAFKNLEESNFEYLIQELQRAIESRDEKVEIENIS